MQQQVLELWQSIYVLQALRDEANVFAEYRDLSLDQARGLYELDVASDLGDSLSQVAAAIHKSTKAEFDLALAWARMDALLGNQVGIGNKQVQQESKP